MVSKSSGSAIASVTVWSSRPTGRQRNWRRNLGESDSVSGEAAGGPSIVTRGMPSCSDRVARTSCMAMQPRSTSVCPSLSPRSFCSSSAFSRSSAVMSFRSRSISPRRILELVHLHGGLQGRLVLHGGEHCALLPMHHHLVRQAGAVLPVPVEQRNAQHYFFTVGYFTKLRRGLKERGLNCAPQLLHALHFLGLGPPPVLPPDLR